MTNLDIALIYLKRKWSIIPIKNGTKVPAIKSWKQFQTRLPTEAEVRTWFMMDHDMGLAVICGKISGIIAVDIDAKSNGLETMKTLVLPPTLVSKTGGGGFHYIYKWREGLIGAAVGLYQGIDVRSDNSYIVLPPTIHVSKKVYEWADDETDIELAPEWLETKNAAVQEKVMNDWDKFFGEKSHQGWRNMNATKMAGLILYDSRPEVWDTLGVKLFEQWNRDYNIPPLSPDELMTTWNSVKKTHMQKNPTPVSVEDTEEIPDNLGPEEEEPMVVKSFLKNKTKGTHDLAVYLTRKFNIITVGEHEREMFVYRDGMYFQAENEIIYPEIQRILNHHVTKNAKTETFHKIADMTSHSRSVFDLAPLKFIPLKNGVYDMETRMIIPHDSKYHFKYQFPIMFDPNAECPKTLAFFNQVMTEDQVILTQEWIGYYFYRLYQFKKAIIFVGEGDTGKTTLLETIIYLLGRENISSVSIQKMTNDKFSAAHLYEKHGNIVDELSAKDITDTGNFKIATGGGSITGEYKFGNQFSFHNFSKFTFACNKIPDVSDFDDLAYFNRWMVVRFEKTIEKKIPNFIQTLITEEERSGLFNWSMKGLERLLANGKFSYNNDAMETKKEMMKSGSSIAMFCAECLAQKEGATMTKEDMYDSYTKYCNQMEMPTETIKMFGSKFPFYVNYASEGLVPDHNGKPVRSRGWRNVVVVDDEDDKMKADEQFNNF